MANGRGVGDWLVVEECYERGDPRFVDEIRGFHDAETLARFAERWYRDIRPASRRLLLEYLDRPLNSFRHEPLVKRLFKLAEAAGDDEVMAAFLVLFDRSIRRVRRRKRHYEYRSTASQVEAASVMALWQAQGYEDVSTWTGWQGQISVHGRWFEEVLAMPRGTTMPRGVFVEAVDFVNWTPKRIRVPDWVVRLRLKPADFRETDPAHIPAELLPRLGRFRLYSVATRQYLRRRAWRYFRKLGRVHPERYVSAISAALIRYTDEDVSDGVALMDNWGFMHALFHHSPALVPDPCHWNLAEDHTLAELEPAPYYARLWKASPRALVDLLTGVRCRPVRQWAATWIRREPAARASVTMEEWLDLLSLNDPEVVSLAAELIREARGLESVSPERWLTLAASVEPAALEILAELMEQHLPPDRVSLDQAAMLAKGRSLPLARLGLTWLGSKHPTNEEECRTLLGLADAEAATVRADLVRWSRGVLSASPHFQSNWVVEILDARHADARAEGLAWLREEPRARDDVAVWQRLMESPYDDVRLALVAELEGRLDRRDHSTAQRLDLDPDALRLLWASVLLNIHRGGRSKPVVIRQLLSRAERRPDDLPRLLPILAVALRSVRGPEWRAGLSAVVRLVERRPDTAPLVHQAFPELQFT